MTIIVYFDDKKKNSQVIRPTKDFNGDYIHLIHSLFVSHIRHEDGTVTTTRNYESFEISQ